MVLYDGGAISGKAPMRAPFDGRFPRTYCGIELRPSAVASCSLPRMPYLTITTEVLILLVDYEYLRYIVLCSDARYCYSIIVGDSRKNQNPLDGM